MDKEIALIFLKTIINTIKRLFIFFTGRRRNSVSYPGAPKRDGSDAVENREVRYQVLRHALGRLPSRHVLQLPVGHSVYLVRLQNEAIAGQL